MIRDFFKKSGLDCGCGRCRPAGIADIFVARAAAMRLDSRHECGPGIGWIYDFCTLNRQVDERNRAG